MAALRFETRFLALALAAGLPPLAIAVALLWTGFDDPWLRWGAPAALVAVWIAAAVALRRRLAYTLNTLANLLEALRREDFSIRARRPSRGGALDAVLREINELGDVLKEQRLGALEASALLRTVMAEIEVAVFAFDPDRRLRLVNRAGERLLARPSRQLVGRPADQLGLSDLLEGPAETTRERAFPGGLGRWGIRRSAFREGGLRHQLLVVTDLSQALREEERKAWQRLIRVIGHELNNSLTPIKSMAATLRSLLDRRPAPEDLADDLAGGLRVIEDRAGSLSRFMASYSRLAKLPPPQPEPIDLAALIGRVASLETRVPVELRPGPPVALAADPEQIEQLLINLLRNGADAALETGGTVTVGWTPRPGAVDLWVEDEGPGPPATANLFVPFFTTKPGGTGIGLVLCRQIAEAHGGEIDLHPLEPRGCRARLRLPLRSAVEGGPASPSSLPDGERER